MAQTTTPGMGERTREATHTHVVTILVTHAQPHIQAFELCHFMVRHEVKKSDNFARLSLMYECAGATIRTVNNVISEASLQSRMFVYIPGLCVCMHTHLCV